MFNMYNVATSSRVTLQNLPPIRHAARYATAAGTTGSSRRRRSDEPLPINADLIAPPDPASNIRPIIYAVRSDRRPTAISPFASEFSAGEGSLHDLELEWKLARERVDMMNHRFWATTNAEFNAQLAHRLQALPPSSDPPSAQDLKRREDCLTQFYADWQITNREKQAKWVKEWWGELWLGLGMQLRVHILRFFKR